MYEPMPTTSPKVVIMHHMSDVKIVIPDSRTVHLLKDARVTSSTTYQHIYIRVEKSH